MEEFEEIRHDEKFADVAFHDREKCVARYVEKEKAVGVLEDHRSRERTRIVPRAVCCERRIAGSCVDQKFLKGDLDEALRKTSAGLSRRARVAL